MENSLHYRRRFRFELRCFSLPLWKSHAWSAAACGDLNAPLTALPAGRRWTHSNGSLHSLCALGIDGERIQFQQRGRRRRWVVESQMNFYFICRLSAIHDSWCFLLSLLRYNYAVNIKLCSPMMMMMIMTESCKAKHADEPVLFQISRPQHARLVCALWNQEEIVFSCRRSAIGDLSLINWFGLALYTCVMRDVCSRRYFMCDLCDCRMAREWVCGVANVALTCALMTFTILHFIWMPVAKAWMQLDTFYFKIFRWNMSFIQMRNVDAMTLMNAKGKSFYAFLIIYFYLKMVRNMILDLLFSTSNK